MAREARLSSRGSGQSWSVFPIPRGDGERYHELRGPKKLPTISTRDNFQMKPAITPGKILLEGCPILMGGSQNALTRAIGISPRSSNDIVLGR